MIRIHCKHATTNYGNLAIFNLYLFFDNLIISFQSFVWFCVLLLLNTFTLQNCTSATQGLEYQVIYYIFSGMLCKFIVLVHLDK